MLLLWFRHEAQEIVCVHVRWDAINRGQHKYVYGEGRTKASKSGVDRSHVSV